jgi:hypothetical protein
MESTCDQLKSGEVFYDTDEGHISCLPPLRVLCSPRRPPVLIRPPGQPSKRTPLGGFLPNKTRLA